MPINMVYLGNLLLQNSKGFLSFALMQDPIHIPFKNQQNPQAEFDVINLSEIFNRTDLNHSPFELHLVEFYLIILIEEGSGKHTIDFTEYDYQAGTLLTIRKDQIQKFHRSKSAKGTLLLFTDAFLVSYLEKLEALKSLQLFNEVLGAPIIQLSKKELTAIADLIQRIQAEYFEINDTYSLGVIRSELHILITKLFRIKSTNNPTIIQRKYLSEFIQFQNLVETHAFQYTKVKDYARLMGLSTKTLNTITQTIVHKTAKAFVDGVCITQIKRLLINTELSIKEIAYTSGFEETTNFYKYFKRQTQLTPEQFRTTSH